MLIPSSLWKLRMRLASLSRRVNANSQQVAEVNDAFFKLIKKGEC